jgi:hypothetical protein
MAALDFPSSPTVGQIYTPGAGAPTYIWSGTAWSQIGQASYTKISSGVAAAQANIDIWFPAAAGFPGGFELLLSNIQPQATTDSLLLRHSNDGSTFQTGASYRYAGRTWNEAGASGGGIQSTAQTYIALTGTTSNASGYKTSFKLFWPGVDNGQGQQVLWDGWYFNGTNIVKINGIGLNNTTAGQGMPLGIRLLNNSLGNFVAGARWQLNGWK